MGKVYESITPALRAFISAQRMFFVTTAPLSADGHVNTSPKGLDTFRMLSPNQVAYLDLTGSGAETIAHLRENGRILFMFCAFEGLPNIVRLHGRGRVVLPGSEDWTRLRPLFTEHVGERSMVVADIDRVSDSCGYGVPNYRFEAQRDGLDRWAQNKGPDELVSYRREKNRRSIDGLPSLDD